MDNEGYIKIHRRFFSHPVAQKPTTRSLALSVLVMANWKPGRWASRNGDIVELGRGEFVTSLGNLAKHAGLSIQQTRTSLLHLTKAEFLTHKPTRHYSKIKVINYSKYQDSQKSTNTTTNTDLTQTQHRLNTDIRREESKKDKKTSNTIFMPPPLEEVKNYCQERKNQVNAEKWFDFYESKGWMIGRNKMKNWKAAVRTWEKNYENKGNSSHDQIKATKDYLRSLDEQG